MFLSHRLMALTLVEWPPAAAEPPRSPAGPLRHAGLPDGGGRRRPSGKSFALVLCLAGVVDTVTAPPRKEENQWKPMTRNR